MFKQTLENFPKQFEWQPKITNADKLIRKEKMIVLGMGGSHLAADLARTWAPYWGKILVHSDYGLPELTDAKLANYLIIASSHSGNTEEVVDGLNAALEKNLAVAVIASGGQLLETAEKQAIPYIKLPAEHGSINSPQVQPRVAVGYSLLAILKLAGEEAAAQELRGLANLLEMEKLKTDSQKLAERLRGKIPIIYASTRKLPLAQIWKIKFNETAKIPAFANAVPELNHNEMAGFDSSPVSRELSEKFSFIILEDKYDHPKNQKRLVALAELLKARGLDAEQIQLQGQNHWHKIFNSVVTADWTSYYLAEFYGVDPEDVPTVEDFKKKLAGQKNL